MTIADASVALTVGLPLALALGMLVPPLRTLVASVASWVAAVPALVLALLPDASSVETNTLVLGIHLYLPGPLTRGFLLGSSLLWLVAGQFARAYMATSERRPSFWFFFLMTMSGNFGVVLANSVVTFYFLYSVMTLAAYGLILHERTSDAHRAGRVYMALAFAGEVLILAACWLIAGAQIDLPLEEVPRAVAAAPERQWIIGLVLAGFGVKAGAIPLHVWLPLAHPVAPTPASAVLSGALIKAGLLGWLRFLPLGETGISHFGKAVALLGIATIFYGAGVGVTQRDAKTVLAYSSVSQMGFMMSALGVALAAPTSAPAATAALIVFAFHHSVAKGALFLGTAIVPRAGTRWERRLARVGILLPALSIVGAPFTSGAVAKTALTAVIDGGPAALRPLHLVLSVGAIGSTLLMARFLGLMLRVPAPRDTRCEPGLWLPWAVLLVGGNALFFVVPPRFAPTDFPLSAEKLWSASWPILVALAIVYAKRRTWQSETAFVKIPAGDLVVLLERQLGHARGVMSDAFERADVRRWPKTFYDRIFQGARAERALGRLEKSEAHLREFGWIGILMLLVLGVLALLLLR
ncbi:MAG TPA: complex I subunit 5 family protein [Labilithrix sp.]|nr:complex I subunit 5 family protein [Labilithrix sp.]